MSNNYPALKPSLNLQFAATGILPPDVTFTRASQSGGYYDGKTVVKAEENLFTNSVWAGAVTGTPGTVPTSWGAGSTGGTYTVTGSSIQAFAATGARHFFTQTINVTTGTTIQITVDVDAVSGTGIDAVVLVVPGTATFTGTSLIDVAAGTGRKTITLTITGTGTVTVRFGAGVNSNVGSDCTVSMKSPQIEIRSAATAYTPTTTQPITRFQPKLEYAIANEPVFDHNPVTGEALGLSIFEARTNLLLRSEEFDNAFWSASSATISVNQVIAPDGTLTMDKLVSAAATGVQQIAPTSLLGLGNGTTNTMSIYISQAGATFAYLNVADTVNSFVWINLVTGSLGTVSAGVTGTIQSVGGAYRVTITRTITSGLNNFRIGLADSDGTTTYTGDGFSGIYIWGAQVEAGAFATPYIPTVGSTVTRSADVAVMTGANFSRWFRADEGTLVVESEAKAQDLIVPFMTIDDNAANSNEYRIVQLNSTATAAGQRVVGISRNNGGIQGLVSSASNISGEFKAAFAYKDNDFAASVNGASAVSDSSGILAVGVDRLFIGTRATNDTFANATIKSIQYYPARLTNDNLVAVTA